MESKHFTSSDADTGAWRHRGESAVTVWMLLGLAFLFLVSCVSPVSTTNPTPQPTSTTPSNPISNTPQLTQQFEFTVQDSGRTVTYVVTSRFEIILNRQKYPKKQVQISCTPQDTLGSVSNLPSVAPPLYVIRY